MRNKHEFKALVEDRVAAQRRKAVITARRRKIALRSAVAILLGLVIVPMAFLFTDLPIADEKAPSRTTQNVSASENGVLEGIPEILPIPEPGQTTLLGDQEENSPAPPITAEPPNEPTPPVLYTFSSLAEVTAFLTNANLTSAELVVPDMELSDENFGCTYYADRSELDLIYRIDGIRYRFVYCYQLSAPLTYDEEPLLADLTLGSAKLDLYPGQNCLVGSYLSGTTTVRVIVYTQQVDDVDFSIFSFKQF
ncbi:MAG: hypothetical protein J6R82_02900 [Clostridia bacterium]|nr:hypothetical protein [Clostridia bacterium]